MSLGIGQCEGMCWKFVGGHHRAQRGGAAHIFSHICCQMFKTKKAVCACIFLKNSRKPILRAKTLLR